MNFTDRDEGNAQRWLPAAVGFLLAIATIIVVGAQNVEGTDAQDYMQCAQTLLRDHRYPTQSSLPFFRAPLYPLLIASIWLIAPGSVAVIKLVQAFLFGATCYLIFQIAETLSGNHRAALIGALLVGCNPFFLSMVARLQTETLHTFLIAAGIHATARILGENGGRLRYSVQAGVALGLAALCRPSALPLGLMMFGAISFLPSEDSHGKRHFKTAAIMIAAMLLAILPWSFTFWSMNGEFFLINDAGGFVLWLGNHPAELRTYNENFASAKQFSDFSNGYLLRDLPAELMRTWNQSTGYPNLSLHGREERWRSEAIKNMRAHPAETLHLWFHKMLAFWRPWLHTGAYPARFAVISGLFLIPLYVCAAVGALLLYRDKRNTLLLYVLALLFVISTAIHTVSHVMMRFRLPYVDPYLSILAGFAITWIPSHLPAFGGLLRSRRSSGE